MKRRKKLRIDRIIIVLIIFCILIASIVFGTIFLNYGLKHNSIKKNNSVKILSSKLKLWNKTINLVKSNKKDITIYRKNYAVILDSSKVKNNMSIDLKVTNKSVDRALFDKVKSVYISNNSLLNNAKKIKVKIPRYLKKNGIVDIYGINEKDETVLIKSNVKTSKYITISTDKKYKEYFITYVKVKNINIKNIDDMKVGDEVQVEISYVPNNSTNKKVNYKVYDQSIVKVEKGKIIALKEGTTKIKISSVDGPNSIIEVIVKKKEEKKDNNKDKKEKFKIEVKDGVTYIDGILIVNKTYSLPSSYNPGGLTDEFMNAFNEMKEAASQDGYELFIASGFRSYEYQQELYDYYVSIDGQEETDKYSSRPGHSEHQTGLAADINAADEWFNDTAEAKWMKENCYKYGFIVRFPEGKEDITGYIYESWHLRYVGKDLAKKLHDLNDITLEEYFGIDSKYKE